MKFLRRYSQIWIIFVLGVSFFNFRSLEPMELIGIISMIPIGIYVFMREAIEKSEPITREAVINLLEKKVLQTKRSFLKRSKSL